MNRPSVRNDEVTGEFLTLAGEQYYVIRNVDRMPPFFISLVSNSDHWLFISSTGGLTAGRVSPDNALFPYITVDKIHESTPHTGSKTLISTVANGKRREWEPFNEPTPRDIRPAATCTRTSWATRCASKRSTMT